VSSRPPSDAPVGHILVVDDIDANREILCRRLGRDGHTFVEASDGIHALEVMEREPVDVVLLDVMMPRMDGMEVLQRLKAHPEWQHIPVIMISAATEVERVIKCIEMGAADYLSKPVDRVLLRARLRGSLERKQARDRERAQFEALQESQAALAAEVGEAAAYAESLLPVPIHGDIRTDWSFMPSSRLGGDFLGHHRLDGDRFAFYLLDVSGHGVGAALLSVSVANSLRSEGLAVQDFGNPGEVLRALNDAYPMEHHNNMYFTAWYGVYSTSTKRLAYGSGGHPPALLVPAQGGSYQELATGGMIIGGMPDLEFASAECVVPSGSALYVFSDGAYEVVKADGCEMTLEELGEIVSPAPAGPPETSAVLDEIKRRKGGGPFDDDLSLLRVVFP
jgi:sigma-B regulation protein RsbU (phosphoserine phosphatase)